MVTKFNVSMSPELYAKLEAACAEMGVTRSAFISFAVSQLINTQRVTGQLPELLEAVKQLQALAAQSPEAFERSAAAERAGLGASLPTVEQES